MQKWEYKRIILSVNTDRVWYWLDTKLTKNIISVEQRINELG
jgi:hypothetical protein